MQQQQHQQHQQQQQQRSARIDLIMKLFPEQNGNLLNSLQHQSSSAQSSLQSQQLQQAAANLPMLTASMQPVNSINPNSSASLSNLVASNLNYPSAMECDPSTPTTSLSSSSLAAGQSNQTAAALNSRYNFLLSGLNAPPDTST